MFVSNLFFSVHVLCNNIRPLTMPNVAQHLFQKGFYKYDATEKKDIHTC